MVYTNNNNCIDVKDEKMEIGGRNFLTVRADVNSNELSKHCIALNDESVLQATDLRRNFTYILVITINQTKLRQKKLLLHIYDFRYTKTFLI